MAAKHYYLFNWRIWTIMTEDDEEEISEELDGPLGATVQLADGNPPAFGFTPWSQDYDWEDIK